MLSRLGTIHTQLNEAQDAIDEVSATMRTIIPSSGGGDIIQTLNNVNFTGLI
jgi:hypothetical protein